MPNTSFSPVSASTLPKFLYGFGIDATLSGYPKTSFGFGYGPLVSLHSNARISFESVTFGQKFRTDSSSKISFTKSGGYKVEFGLRASAQPMLSRGSGVSIPISIAANQRPVSQGAYNAQALPDKLYAFAATQTIAGVAVALISDDLGFFKFDSYAHTGNLGIMPTGYKADIGSTEIDVDIPDKAIPAEIGGIEYRNKSLAIVVFNAEPIAFTQEGDSTKVEIEDSGVRNDFVLFVDFH